MLTLRRSQDRGFADHGWLKSKHTFSFADYYDPQFMGFRVLRVINEDRVEAGKGFGTHPHRDMEIISYVIDGELRHQDSMGNSTLIKPGEVQRMSAGTGIRHSEYNNLPDRESHFLQIWILPEKAGIEPGYEQKSFAKELQSQGFLLAASRDGRDGSISLHQNCDLYLGHFHAGQEKKVSLGAQRHGWLQIVRGELIVNNEKLTDGDALSISDESEISLRALTPSEFLFFDLP